MNSKETSDSVMQAFLPRVGNHPFLPTFAQDELAIESWRIDQYKVYSTRTELADLLQLMIQVEDDEGLRGVVMELERFVSRYAANNPNLIRQMEVAVKKFLSSPGNASLLADMRPLGHA
ncbi:hypothetical protein [Aquitalea palustris]|uniref:hypothetical protein n=1 Tax=Aquitalea palustris TaxID=2480983 RepID=UPI001CF05ABC|nr:hypothetical protein [Aquitalea palustris]